jgi:exopolysaccharide production protein ExoZ
MVRSSYFCEIDLIRFLSAVSVVGFHLAYLNHGVAEYRPVWFATWSGWIGVEIFFVISGFVIANSASNATAVAFVKGRCLRLYPAAWFCATVTLMVVGANLTNMPSYFRSLVLLPKGPWIDDVYWTLSVEVSFYAVITLLLKFQMFPMVGRLAFAMTAVNSLGVSILIARHFGFFDVGGPTKLVDHANLVFARHGSFFALGIWIWLSTVRSLTRWEIFGCGLAAITCMIEILLRGAEFLPFQSSLWLLEPLVIWCAAVIGIAVFSRAPSKRDFGLLRQLGLMTYPLYLVHNVVGRAMEGKIIELGIEKWSALLASAFAMIGLSWLVCRFFEPRCRQLMKLLI